MSFLTPNKIKMGTEGREGLAKYTRSMSLSPSSPPLSRLPGFYSTPRGIEYEVYILSPSHNRMTGSAESGAMLYPRLIHSGVKPFPPSRCPPFWMLPGTTFLISPTPLKLNSFKTLQVVKTTTAVILKTTRGMGTFKRMRTLALCEQAKGPANAVIWRPALRKRRSTLRICWCQLRQTVYFHDFMEEF